MVGDGDVVALPLEGLEVVTGFLGNSFDGGGGGLTFLPIFVLGFGGRLGESLLLHGILEKFQVHQHLGREVSCV